MALNNDEIYRRLRYYPPKGKQADIYLQIRSATLDYALYVAELLPEGREKSHFMTLVEDAQMWANKAVAVNQAHTEDLPWPKVLTD